MKLDYPCKEKNSCTGCGLCAEICHQKCISMIPNTEGFLYPKIDKEKCVSCGLCSIKCPMNNSNRNERYKKKFYSASNSELRQLKISSSGGIFLALVNVVMANNGYVAGCVYNENMEAVHTVSNDINCVERMCGSKYVQSRAFECYADVKKLLQSGYSVLFTGTACQVMAIREYVGEYNADKLITMEILCHGVPSPSLFSKYVSYLENRLRGEIVDVQFRNKEKYGWGSEHKTCVKYIRNSVVKSYRPFMPAYFSAFFYGMNLRESCYRCKYANSDRVADLTVGDFWGSWYKFKKEFPEGISVISVNTSKGNEIFDSIKEKCFNLFEIEELEAMKSNDNYFQPVKRTNDREWFYKSLDEYDGLWKRVYFAKHYRKKIIKSLYGALVPKKIRMMRHQK